jgi:hypothetical protein
MLIAMKKTFLLLVLIFGSFLNSIESQNLSDCNLEVHKGRRTNFVIDKIALYTGKDFKNDPVKCYDRVVRKEKTWRKDGLGVFCLVDTVRYDSTYVVTDTAKCPDFKMYYWVSYRDLVKKGTKTKMKGFCPDKMTNELIKELIDKLLAEDLLYEIPNDTFGNWQRVIPIAIMKYQQKYDLAVGLLTVETARHMKLHF